MPVEAILSAPEPSLAPLRVRRPQIVAEKPFAAMVEDAGEEALPPPEKAPSRVARREDRPGRVTEDAGPGPAEPAAPPAETPAAADEDQPDAVTAAPGADDPGPDQGAPAAEGEAIDGEAPAEVAAVPMIPGGIAAPPPAPAPVPGEGAAPVAGTAVAETAAIAATAPADDGSPAPSVAATPGGDAPGAASSPDAATTAPAPADGDGTGPSGGRDQGFGQAGHGDRPRADATKPDAAASPQAPPADRPAPAADQPKPAPAEAAPDPQPADTARADGARTDLPPPTSSVADTSRLPGPSALATTQQSQSPAVTVPQLAATIIAHAKQGESRFQIRLDPPDLGRIDVSLSIDQAGTAATVLTVEKMDTLDLLQRDSRALERALNTAGFRTEQGSLQFNLRDPGTGSQGFSQQHAQQDQGQWRRIVFSDDLSAPLHPLQAGIASYDAAYRRIGGLDIKV